MRVQVRSERQVLEHAGSSHLQARVWVLFEVVDDPAFGVFPERSGCAEVKLAERAERVGWREAEWFRLGQCRQQERGRDGFAMPLVTFQRTVRVNVELGVREDFLVIIHVVVFQRAPADRVVGSREILFHVGRIKQRLQARLKQVDDLLYVRRKWGRWELAGEVGRHAVAVRHFRNQRVGQEQVDVLEVHQPGRAVQHAHVGVGIFAGRVLPNTQVGQPILDAVFAVQSFVRAVAVVVHFELDQVGEWRQCLARVGQKRLHLGRDVLERDVDPTDEVCVARTEFFAEDIEREVHGLIAEVRLLRVETGLEVIARLHIHEIVVDRRHKNVEVLNGDRVISVAVGVVDADVDEAVLQPVKDRIVHASDRDGLRRVPIGRCERERGAARRADRGFCCIGGGKVHDDVGCRRGAQRQSERAGCALLENGRGCRSAGNSQVQTGSADSHDAGV